MKSETILKPDQPELHIARRRRVAVLAGTIAAAAGVSIGVANVIPWFQEATHELVVRQNASALDGTHSFRDGQLSISQGTHVYGAPDTARNTDGNIINNSQAVGSVPDGGYIVVDPVEYTQDGQDWYGFVDPALKEDTNAANKIHWVSGAALGTKDANGHYIANWEGGHIPDLKDGLGFDKVGNPIDTAAPLQDSVTSAHVAFVDGPPSR